MEENRKMRVFSSILLVFLITTLGIGKSFTKIDSEKLKHLIEGGKETNSDAVIVIQDGKTLVEEYYGKEKGAVYIASAGKSLTALAIGKLIDQGKIKSLDQPVSDFYPEWIQGNKKQITIRMLLNHTSGIQNIPNASVEIERKYPPVNVIKLAIAAELTNLPGTNWSYNNKAVGLLAGIIEKASGKRMDIYFADEFYSPMNIADYNWIWDEDGNPLAYGGHMIEPMGLAKFGILMLNGGQFEGKQIVSRAFVEEAVKPGQKFFTASGLLWWRYTKTSKSVIDTERFIKMRQDKINAEFLQKIAPLENKVFESDNEYFAALEKALGKEWRKTLRETLKNTNYGLRKRIFSDETIGYYASGFRGNYLLVMPEDKLIAVRVVRNSKNYNWNTDGFGDFLQLAAELTGKSLSPPPVR